MAYEESTVEFRDVPGFSGYRVGSDGTVWSSRRGRWIRLKESPVGSGYLRVVIAGVHWRVHRLVLTVFVGPCPDGQQACHNNGHPADNRLENLRWGTPKENANDRSDHGRTARGSGQPNAKLHESDIVSIKHAYMSGGQTLEEIGAQYGVSGTAIYFVVRGKGWRHAGGDAVEFVRRRGPRPKLTEANVREIRECYASGNGTYASIGMRFGVDFSTVYGIVKRKTWAHIP